MVNQLKGMNIKQVHLTGSPAVRKKYLFFKSEDGMGEDTTQKTQEEAKKQEEEMKKSAEEAEAKIKDAEARAEAATKEAAEVKEKAETELKARDGSLLKSALDILKSSGADVATPAIEALEAALNGTKVEKSTKTTAEEVAEIVKSAMPELIKPIEEPLRKELEEIKKSNALLVGEKTEREIEEIVKSIAGDKEANREYVRLMKSKLDEEAFDKFVKREQEQAETLRKSNVFKESGSTGDWKSAGSGTAYQELVDIANGMIQKSSDGKLQFNDAFAKATTERPDLWDKYRNESYDTKAREDN